MTAVAGIDSQPLVYYMGATGGGVWKTEDAGTTWTMCRTAFRNRFGGRRRRSPRSNPDIVYVGMGEACLRGNLSSGDGVYKSTDAGKTWTHVGLPDTSQIGRIRVHPTNPDVAVRRSRRPPVRARTPSAASSGSKDGGKHWQKVLFVDDKTGAADIAMDPSNPQVLYATTWQVLRTPWDITSTGPGGGLYKSTDGGDTWTKLTSGLPAGEPREDRRHRLAGRIRSASGRPWKPTRRAASIDPMMAARRGNC